MKDEKDDEVLFLDVMGNSTQVNSGQNRKGKSFSKTNVAKDKMFSLQSSKDENLNSYAEIKKENSRRDFVKSQ